MELPGSTPATCLFFSFATEGMFEGWRPCMIRLLLSYLFFLLQQKGIDVPAWFDSSSVIFFSFCNRRASTSLHDSTPPQLSFFPFATEGHRRPCMIRLLLSYLFFLLQQKGIDVPAWFDSSSVIFFSFCNRRASTSLHDSTPPQLSFFPFATEGHRRPCMIRLLLSYLFFLLQQKGIDVPAWFDSSSVIFFFFCNRRDVWRLTSLHDSTPPQLSFFPFATEGHRRPCMIRLLLSYLFFLLQQKGIDVPAWFDSSSVIFFSFCNRRASTSLHDSTPPQLSFFPFATEGHRRPCMIRLLLSYLFFLLQQKGCLKVDVPAWFDSSVFFFFLFCKPWTYFGTEGPRFEYFSMIIFLERLKVCYLFCNLHSIPTCYLSQ